MQDERQIPQWVIELAEKIAKERYDADNSLGVSFEKVKQYGIDAYLFPRVSLGNPESRDYKYRLTSLMRFDMSVAMSKDARIKMDFCCFLRGRLKTPKECVRAIDFLNIMLSYALEPMWAGKNVWEMTDYDAILELRDSLKDADSLVEQFWAKFTWRATTLSDKAEWESVQSWLSKRDSSIELGPIMRALTRFADFRGKWDVFSDEDLQAISEATVRLRNIPREKLTTLLLEQSYAELYFLRQVLIGLADESAVAAAGWDKLLRLFPLSIVEGLKNRCDTGFNPSLSRIDFDTILGEHLYR